MHTPNPNLVHVPKLEHYEHFPIPRAERGDEDQSETDGFSSVEKNITHHSQI